MCCISGYIAYTTAFYTTSYTAEGSIRSSEAVSIGPMGTWMGQRHVINITDVSGDVLLCSGGSKWVPRDDLAVTDHPYLHAIQQSAIQHAIQV